MNLKDLFFLFLFLSAFIIGIGVGNEAYEFNMKSRGMVECKEVKLHPPKLLSSSTTRIPVR